MKSVSYDCGKACRLGYGQGSRTFLYKFNMWHNTAQNLLITICWVGQRDYTRTRLTVQKKRGVFTRWTFGNRKW
jgi:hypothetical protein